MKKCFISIIIPTYNRPQLLHRCLRSINSKKLEEEVIIIDDGSNYNIKKLIRKFKKKINIKYYKIPNSGRSFAMKEGILKASGAYSIIMDDDDVFLENGLFTIKNCIKILKSKTMYSDINNYVFGTIVCQNNKKIFNIPPEKKTAYLDLRIKYKIKSDLKEVVETDILKKIVKKISIKKFERFPTGLIWANISEKVDFYSFSKVVVTKNYLDGGITSEISLSKLKSPAKMQDLYFIYSCSKKYTSFFFRIRSMILWSRYYIHNTNKKKNSLTIWQFLFLAPGIIIYIVDKIKIFANLVIKNIFFTLKI